MNQKCYINTLNRKTGSLFYNRTPINIFKDSDNKAFLHYKTKINMYHYDNFKLTIVINKLDLVLTKITNLRFSTGYFFNKFLLSSQDF
jgi:hypothetical protein